jgi:cell division protein FtsW
MKKKKSFDIYLLGIIIFLIFIGFCALSSSSSFFSASHNVKPSYYLIRQLMFGLLPGLVLGLIFFFIRLELIKKIAPWFFLTTLFALILVFVPIFGTTSGGATRWLNIGRFGLQPAEFLKLGVILYFSLWLSAKKRTKTQSITGLSLLFLSLVVLYLQPNVSTLLFIAAIIIIIFFASDPPWKHIIASVVSFLSMAVLLIKIAPYRLQRFLTMMNPDADPQGAGLQIRQAMIAIGSGGLFGVGLGLSRQKAGFIPETINDTIFAIYCEEVGFVGAVVLITALLTFLVLGFKISRRAPDKFSSLVAIGISSWIVLQAFINIAAMTRLLPLAGVPFPLMSYGGSHYMAEMAAMGILLNISKNRI